MIQSAKDIGAFFEVTLSDGTVLWVPRDTGNADYVRLQSWVAGGGVISQG